MCVFNAFLLRGNIKRKEGGSFKKIASVPGKVVLDAFLAMKAAQRAGGSG